MAAEERHLFLLRFSGELSIKAKGTRERFTQRLVANLGDGLAAAGIDHDIRRSWSRIFLRATSPLAGEVAERTFGVQSVSPAAERAWETLDDLVEAAYGHFAAAVRGKTFAVRVRRSGERDKIPFRSADLERRLGARLLVDAAAVDLDHPGVTAGIEVFPGRAYFFGSRREGPGGIPLGVEGRAVALVSGGFDSAVAAWCMLRRGVELHYVFCNLGGDRHRDGVLAVMKVLADRWSHGTRPELHMVDFRPLVERLQERCPARLWQLLLKRLMLRAAEQVNRIVGGVAIVTGEAVAQVSSQTLHNLAVISQVTQVPILRPVVGCHKEEIVRWARHVGTHDLSSQVPEYCALAAPRPATRAALSQVLRAEEALDPRQLDLLIAERAVFDLRALDLAKVAAPDLEVEEVPEGAVVIDLRSRTAYDGWHYPGASHREYREAVRSHRSFPPGRCYLFYCEVGLKSAHLAELLVAAGHRAYHVRGGVRQLLRSAERHDAALAAALSPALR